MIEIESDDSNGVGEYNRLPYTVSRPLVEDEYMQYIFFLSDEDATDYKMETIYGPFVDNNEVSTPSPRSMPQADPSMWHRKKIDELKRVIQVREANMLRQQKAKEEAELLRQTSFTQVPQQQNAGLLLESTPEILGSTIEEQILEVKKTDAILHELEETGAMAYNENALKLQSTDNFILTSMEKSESSKTVPSTNVITIDSDSDMEVDGENSTKENKESSPKEDKESSTKKDEKSANKEDEKSSNKENNPNSSSTSKKDLSVIPEDVSEDDDPVTKAELEESNLLEAEIKDLKNLLVKVEEERRIHQLKLLGLKVKISINKNRRAAPRQTTSHQPASPNPVVGTKRKPHSYSHPLPKRRTPVDPYTNAQSSLAQPFQHQIPAFYPQINPIPSVLPAALPHFGPPMPNYYHPVPPMDMPLASSSTFHPLPSPPPPPPSELPPPPSPPPPPPPEIKKNVPPPSLPKSTRAQRRETPYAGLNDSNVIHAEDFENMSSILCDVEQLVTVRIFKENDRPNVLAIKDRPLPRPYRLISFDGYTMPMQVISLEEATNNDSEWKQRNQTFILPAGLPILFEMTDRCYESPLFNILLRKAQGEKFDPSLDNIISAILISIPSDMDLTTFHVRHDNGISLEPEKMQNTYNLVRAFRQDYPTNQFYAALTLELCLYVYGPGSPQFQLDYVQSEKTLSLQVDVEWQYVLEADSIENQMNRIKVLLQRIDKSRISLKSDESATASCKTAEILTRVIRLYGIEQVLKLLTGSTTINATQPSIFSLNGAAGLFLMEKDKLYVWMLILHYLITNSLPQAVCNSWMSHLVKNAEPVISMPLFTLDWTETLKETPLDKDTLYAATNLLLSLFSHYGNRTCSDTREKPLFIGVIRTMISFLSSTLAYTIHGALLLTAKMGGTNTLQPEIGEMITELQFKRENSPRVPLKFLMDDCKIAHRSQLFSLAHSMVCLYNQKNVMNSENCLLLACMLWIPLHWNRSNLETVLSDDLKTYDNTKKGNLVDGIRLKYMDVLNLESRRKDTPLVRTLRKNAFVWINLLLLTKFTIMFRPQLAHDLEGNLGQVFIEGRKYLTSYDGKMIFFKYAKKFMD